MTFTITTNGIAVFLGLALLAWLAGNVGSLIGAIYTGFRAPKEGGQNLFTAAGMMMMAFGPLQVAKIPIALGATALAMYLNPAAPLKLACLICAGIAVAFMLLVGHNQRD